MGLPSVDRTVPTIKPGALLVYDGTLADLYQIFWRNLVLTVVTLGLFRFWAITRNRRYLWSHMRFEGDRFEYVGTGGEKLSGFLKALAIILVLWLANFAAKLLTPPGTIAPQVVTSLAYAGGLLLLGQMAPFTAQRYRLLRTRWRGLGGGMRGSAPRYGFISFFYLLANVLSLFMLTPLRRMRLARRRLRASSFGRVDVEFHSRHGLAYWPFVGAYAARALVVAFSFIGFGLAYNVLQRLGYRMESKGSDFQRFLLAMTLVSIALYPAVNRLCGAWYDAAVLRRLLAQVGIMDLRFASGVTGRALFALRFGNVMIALATLGLGAPIVRQRCARFVAARLVVTGSFDPGRLGRERARMARDAEGLFEALDVGFLY